MNIRFVKVVNIKKKLCETEWCLFFDVVLSSGSAISEKDITDWLSEAQNNIVIYKKLEEITKLKITEYSFDYQREKEITYEAFVSQYEAFVSQYEAFVSQDRTIYEANLLITVSMTAYESEEK
jgi:hypothetical protein